MHDMLGAARVDQLDADARIQEGELAIAVLELLEIELDDVLERLGRGLKGDARALLARGRGAADDERGDRIAMFEAHPMLFAVAPDRQFRSEEHTSELQSLMRISYAVFCLEKKKTQTQHKIE